jgi:hypothetical protein
MPAMNTLADSLRHELQGLETVLHRLTTLRLMMATGAQRSIERAATELDEALVALGAAETARVEALRGQGFTAVTDAIAASDEPLRSDLALTRTRLARTHQEVLGAAQATSTMASRSLGQVQATLRDLGASSAGATWQSYGPGGVRPGSGATVGARVGFVEGSL